MKSLESVFVTLCRWGTGLAFCILIATVLLQVLGRAFASSPVWTEELTRFALLYMAAFGAGLSLRSGELVNVDIVCESLGGKGPVVLRFVSSVAIAGLCLTLLGPAWQYVSIGALQTSPALGIRMNLIHGSILLLLVVLMVIALFRAIGIVLGRDSGMPDSDETVS